MRSVLPLILLLTSLAAVSQEEVYATPAETTWMYVTVITSWDAEDMFENLRPQGFSEAGMEALRAHVSDGTAQLNALARSGTETVCARRADFERDPETLAQEFERQEAEDRALRERLVDQLDDVLGPADAAILLWMMAQDLFLKTSDGQRGLRIDVPGAVRSGTLTPADAADAACDALTHW